MTTPRVLILGGSGMLGHKLWQVLEPDLDVHVTVRRAPRAEVLDPDRTLTGVTAEDFDTVALAVAAARPDVVVNCIGIVKQAAAARDPLPSISVNSLFPHRLARLCDAGGTRLIHISTDCVFSGRAGRYAEDDIPDPVDLYGRSKLLGEASEGGSLTVRTSIIGRELAGANGLLEWFLGETGTVRGFRHAIFSGLTTHALARVLGEIIRDHRDLTGLWHVAADPISKLDLLCLLKERLRRPMEITADETVILDRSLDGSAFAQRTGIRVPSWPEMIDQIAADDTPYDQWRSLTG